MGHENPVAVGLVSPGALAGWSEDTEEGDRRSMGWRLTQMLHVYHVWNMNPYIYPKNDPNVAKYCIYGAYG